MVVDLCLSFTKAHQRAWVGLAYILIAAVTFSLQRHGSCVQNYQMFA